MLVQVTQQQYDSLCQGYQAPVVDVPDAGSVGIPSTGDSVIDDIIALPPARMPDVIILPQPAAPEPEPVAVVVIPTNVPVIDAPVIQQVVILETDNAPEVQQIEAQVEAQIEAELSIEVEVEVDIEVVEDEPMVEEPITEDEPVEEVIVETEPEDEETTEEVVEEEVVEEEVVEEEVVEEEVVEEEVVEEEVVEDEVVEEVAVVKKTVTKKKVMSKKEKQKAKEKKMKELKIQAVPKPRMTRADTWKKIAVLINYVPGFDSYGQMMIPGVDFYQSESIYKDKKIPENQRGLLNGLASELLHKKMVDMQYEGMD